jgi:DNA-binding NtrC family response regulator
MPGFLIVSDELVQRSAIQQVASKVGYTTDEITCPESWEAAIGYMRAPEYGVAIVDIELWGRWEGGVDFVRQLHAEQPFCYILALTGRRGDDSGLRAMRAGASDFINTQWECANWPELLERKLALYKQLALSRHVSAA